MSTSNHSDPKMQPLTVSALSQDHVGQTISVLGYPPRVLTYIQSSPSGKSVEMWLGEHHLYIPVTAKVSIVSTEKVDGL